MALARGRSVSGARRRQARQAVRARARRQAARPRAVPERHELAAKLERAVDLEDYAAAAALRDELRELDAANPAERLRAELKDAVEAEDYALASRLKRELDDTVARPSLPCGSDATTLGVQVKVTSAAIEEARPGEYLFAYKVKVTNHRGSPVQLLSRHWVVEDALGNTREVRGPGVVGEKPVIGAGESFTYTSSVTCDSAHGVMRGRYKFTSTHVGEAEAVAEQPQNKRTFFAVDVAPFALSDACPVA